MRLSTKAKELIDGRNFASVATLMQDGSPQVAPLWIDREGDTIILNTTRSRQRTKNVRRDRRVAITVFDQGNPYSNVSIRGKAIEITEEGAEEHIDRMSMKYLGKPYPYEDRTPKDPRVLIRVEAEHIHEEM
ncbi:MAG: PPOX class F420-dependent oxidoreductase [Nitrososphaerales archaeon]|jgi:PPOX class probable F420-dependent enzyme